MRLSMSGDPFSITTRGPNDLINTPVEEFFNFNGNRYSFYAGRPSSTFDLSSPSYALKSPTEGEMHSISPSGPLEVLTGQNHSAITTIPAPAFPLPVGAVSCSTTAYLPTAGVSHSRPALHLLSPNVKGGSQRSISHRVAWANPIPTSLSSPSAEIAVVSMKFNSPSHYSHLDAFPSPVKACPCQFPSGLSSPGSALNAIR